MDHLAGLKIDQSWRVAAAGVVRVRQHLTNSGKATFVLTRLSSIAMPLPARFAEVFSYSGRWTGEMRETRRAIAPMGCACDRHGKNRFRRQRHHASRPSDRRGARRPTCLERRPRNAD
ncbi:MAG: hypothetical protein HC788_15885 [Sphingopyxis sp.]|nr:hypothetical protein [Sphingopyxis sp.]